MTTGDTGETRPDLDVTVDLPEESVVLDGGSPLTKLSSVDKPEEQRITTAADEELVDPRDRDFKTVLKLTNIIGIHWISVILMCLFSAAQGVVPMAFFLIIGDLISGLGTASASDVGTVVNNMALYLTFIAIAAAVVAFFSALFNNLASTEISNRIKRAYFNSVTSQEIAFFDYKKGGHLLKLITEDVTKITASYSGSLSTISMSMGQLIAGAVLAFKSSWSMTLLGFCSIPFIIIIVIISGLTTSYLTRRADTQLSGSVSTANEVISSMKTVRSMAGEKKEVDRYNRDLSKIGVTGALSALCQGFSVGLNGFFLWAALSLSFWFAGRLVNEGSMLPGNLISMWGYIVMSAVGIQNMLNTIGEVYKSQESGKLLLNVIYREPAMRYKGGEAIKQVQGHIEFKNVTFRYPTRPKVTVLKDFTVEILPGKSVALVGPSGSGKSTIVGLLEKWYEPEQGLVTIDGVDLKKIDPQFLHRHVGIVQQEPTLFATTIKRNIMYAVECANGIIRANAEADKKSEQEIEKMLIPVSDEAVFEAARAANAHDFITKLPMGYETILGERGVSLSGGQKQRVAIARALLQNPSILLLDEATSALDTKSEALVQDALEKLMIGRTSIVIAHRLSTVQNCDTILVLKRGVIVESGTHDQLIQNEDGVYSGLAKKQMAFGRSNSATKSLHDIANESSVDTSTDGSVTDEVKTATTPVQDVVAVPLIAAPTKDVEEPKKKKKFAFPKKKKEFTNEEEVKDEREPKIVSALPILATFGFEWILILVAIIAAAAAGVVPIMFQLVFGRLIDTITPRRTAEGGVIPFPPGYSYERVISEYALYLFIIAIGSGTALFLSTFLSNLARERLGVKLKRIYFTAILKQEMGFFDIKKSGKLLSSLAEDVLAVQDGYSTKLTLFCQHIVQFIAGIAIAISASWQMSLVMLGAGIGSTVIVIVITGAVANFFNKKIMDLTGSSTTTASEVFGSIRTVKSMSGEDRERNRFNTDLKRISVWNVFRAFALGLSIAGIFFAIWSDSALAFWYGGQLVARGELGAGNLFQVFGNILFAVMGIGMAMSELQNFLKADAGGKQILMVLKRVPAIDGQGGKKLDRIEGNVEFSGIDFAYPSRPNITVLKNFTLSIAKGQHIALVGESGCGKSTITGLLERFYDPHNGTVKIDGVDIKELDVEWLHRNIAIVTQEPVLFATSIRKNITYAVGDENVNMDQVIEAAKAANAHDFIASLPDGYDTLVGERGVSMSGGQKQRIAIARAMLQNSSILILDEATSALDTEAEALVQGALDKLMVGKTSIVIAHRLTTVRDCDSIVVLKAGEVVESGTHDELLQKNGLYFKLAQKQLNYGGEGVHVTITDDD